MGIRPTMKSTVDQVSPSRAWYCLKRISKICENIGNKRVIFEGSRSSMNREADGHLQHLDASEENATSQHTQPSRICSQSSRERDRQRLQLRF